LPARIDDLGWLLVEAWAGKSPRTTRYGISSSCRCCAKR
jgi:hypothetical protein